MQNKSQPRPTSPGCTLQHAKVIQNQNQSGHLDFTAKNAPKIPWAFVASEDREVTFRLFRVSRRSPWDSSTSKIGCEDCENNHAHRMTNRSCTWLQDHQSKTQ